MLANLKLQIFRRGSHQNQLAEAVGIDETVLSKIIHGFRLATPLQRRALATYLEADEEWLFENFRLGSRIPGRVSSERRRQTRRHRDRMTLPRNTDNAGTESNRAKSAVEKQPQTAPTVFADEA
jgi:transcriptional regulator with XRE-family HTH domain